MRIFASIFFLAILLFNNGGYHLLTRYMEQQQDTRLELQLDAKQYDESTLIEIRVPVNLPYQTDWKEFERVNGEVTFNGMHYKFVERKLQGGEMIYKCIPNQGKALIVNARDNFFKLVNDLQTKHSSNKKPSSTSQTVKIFNFGYCEQMKSWVFHTTPNLSSSSLFHQTEAVRNIFLSFPEQPPEA